MSGEHCVGADACEPDDFGSGVSRVTTRQKLFGMPPDLTGHNRSKSGILFSIDLGHIGASMAESDLGRFQSESVSNPCAVGVTQLIRMPMRNDWQVRTVVVTRNRRLLAVPIRPFDCLRHRLAVGTHVVLFCGLSLRVGHTGFGVSGRVRGIHGRASKSGAHGVKLFDCSPGRKVVVLGGCWSVCHEHRLRA